MLKHEQTTEKVIGVYYEVYNELGHGFVEAVYERDGHRAGASRVDSIASGAGSRLVSWPVDW